MYVCIGIITPCVYKCHTHTHTQEFLAHEQENNKEVEKKLATSERESSKLRLQYQDTEASLQQLKDEVRHK